MEWIPGMNAGDELDMTAKILYRERKEIQLDWLLNLRPWIIKFDLTFRSIASPERAEKAVRRWLGLVIPGGWAVVGYERQDRGAVHAHGLTDTEFDTWHAIKLWEPPSCGARIAYIKSSHHAIAYAVKHAIKSGEVDIYSSGKRDHWLKRGGVFSTGDQHTLYNVSSSAQINRPA